MSKPFKSLDFLLRLMRKRNITIEKYIVYTQQVIKDFNKPIEN